jgi:hypothetical protein
VLLPVAIEIIHLEVEECYGDKGEKKLCFWRKNKTKNYSTSAADALLDRTDFK